jgi:hypothetical protein
VRTKACAVRFDKDKNSKSELRIGIFPVIG